jgi:hypothetical protein
MKHIRTPAPPQCDDADDGGAEGSGVMRRYVYSMQGQLSLLTTSVRSALRMSDFAQTWHGVQ